MCTYNLSDQEPEAGLWAQGQPGLHSKFLSLPLAVYIKTLSQNAKNDNWIDNLINEKNKLIFEYT